MNRNFCVVATLMMVGCGGVGPSAGPADPAAQAADLDRDVLAARAPAAAPNAGAPAPAVQNVELCFELGNDFTANGGDFPLPATTYKARGIRFRVTDAA